MFLGEDILINSPIELTLQEIHNLAYFYHWGRDECWNMPCTERGVFNDKIRQQLKAENESGNKSGNNRGNASETSYVESF